jgi:hypothetical protein
MSATSDGTRITCDGVDVIAVVDGRIARKDTYLDWPAIQTQLGPELATSLTTQLPQSTAHHPLSPNDARVTFANTGALHRPGT